MESTYRATAALNDGREISTQGTIMECSNWADNVIRSNDGSIRLSITEIRPADAAEKRGGAA